MAIPIGALLTAFQIASQFIPRKDQSTSQATVPGPQGGTIRGTSTEGPTPAALPASGGGLGSIPPEILNLLISGAAAGIGLASPAARPAAAGFSQGFTKEKTRQAKEEGTKDFIIIDPETGEQQSFPVPKGALVQQKRAKASSLFPPGFGFSIGKDGSPIFSQPETKTGDAVKKSEADRKSRNERLKAEQSRRKGK